MALGVVHQEHRHPAPRRGALHPGMHRGTELCRTAPLVVQPKQAAVPQVDGGGHRRLRIGARRRYLQLHAPPHPGAGQGGQQGQLRLILGIQIGLPTLEQPR